MREDAGLSRRVLAAAAGIDDGYLGQLRWATEKAEALPTSIRWAQAGAIAPTVHRLMILRSTRTNRTLAAQFATTLAIAYPADPHAAIRALTEPAATWPGSAWLWATLDHETARLHGPA